MNTFIKKLIGLVIVFLILIPLLFYAKSEIEKKELAEQQEKIELQKKAEKELNEKKAAEEKAKEEAKRQEALKNQEQDNKLKDDKSERKNLNQEKIKEKIENLKAEIKIKNEQLDRLQKLVAKKDKKNQVKSFVESYDAVEVRDNMENPDYTGKKLAFLTFDDGVNTVITDSILKTLNDNEINATFFIPGYTLEDENNHEILKKLYADGNSIATHSYHHDYSILYPNRIADSKAIVEEHEKTVNKLKSILGEDFDTKLFRYPGGHMSWDRESIKKSDEALAKLGVKWIDWNSMTGDAQPVNAGPNDISRPKNVDEVISNFEKSLHFTYNPDQVVILMHDALDKELTAESLQALINHLTEKGYEFGILK